MLPGSILNPRMYIIKLPGIRIIVNSSRVVYDTVSRQTPNNSGIPRLRKSRKQESSKVRFKNSKRAYVCVSECAAGTLSTFC